MGRPIRRWAGNIDVRNLGRTGNVDGKGHRKDRRERNSYHGFKPYRLVS